MAARKRPAAALDAFPRDATTQHQQQSATSRGSCKRSRAFIGCTDDYPSPGGVPGQRRLPASSSGVRHKVTKKDLAVGSFSSPDDLPRRPDVEDLHREAGFLEGMPRKFTRRRLRGYMVHGDLDAGDVFWPRHGAGTSSYIAAPEMISGKRDYDALVDSWSIEGCVFAELLTGATPLFMLDDEDEEKDRTQDRHSSSWGASFRVLRVPDERTWPGCTSLPSFTVGKAPQLLQGGEGTTGCGICSLKRSAFV
ncbi:hypothetical protein ZWY2020_054552 [Hordeum vulgare]|nr:hypothetical protein ZWY2020_054552 [Hordeum vulgare]